MKRKLEVEKNEEEKKRKRQMSLGKKKVKSNSKKENPKRSEKEREEKVDEFKINLKEINAKFDPLFADVGLDRNDLVVYKVKADGACASNCTALHCHQDERLGPYVRRNTNKYLVDFWPFFQPYFIFPHCQSVGSEILTFNDETEYISFLRDDPRSAWLWMDHGDLQAVANMYQISIHILTTGVEGMEEPKARWTHLVPDNRLRSFNTIQIDLLDMWMIHEDDSHFDLIIPKESILAKEGSICQREYNKTKEDLNVDNLGPGYMGWQKKDAFEEPSKKVYEDLVEAYDELKEDYKELKLAFDVLNKKIDIQDKAKNVDVNMQDKNLKKLKAEIKRLKEDYRICMDAVQKETHERMKAETIANTLKDTIEAEKELKETEMEIDESIEEISVPNNEEEVVTDEQRGDWKFPKNNRSKKSRKSDDNSINNQTSAKELFECDQCDKKFKETSELKDHMKYHIQVNNKSETKCDKCDKKYSNMSKLRRHDWRSHREIECNICGDKLESRQDISLHRQIEHQMFRKVTCKFFPECIDGDECFFEHKDNNQAEMNKNSKNVDICPNGEKCSDQSCSYSEWKHIKGYNALCKFQANCNRVNCMFVHNVQRKAFLGAGFLNSKEK